MTSQNQNGLTWNFTQIDQGAVWSGRGESGDYWISLESNGRCKAYRMAGPGGGVIPMPSIRLGEHHTPEEAISFIEQHREEIEAMPLGFPSRDFVPRSSKE